MKCEHILPDLKGLTNYQAMLQLGKERNDFAKSRQQWIQAAFDMVYRGDDTLFDKLVDEELCETCKLSYAKPLIKTEI